METDKCQNVESCDVSSKMVWGLASKAAQHGHGLLAALSAMDLCKKEQT